MKVRNTLKKILSQKADGFTYVETLVCLAVILILTLAVTVSAVKMIDRAKETKCRKEMEAFAQALEEYYVDCGRFPSQEQGLDALWQKPVLYPVPSGWQGPYLSSEIPLDPWGNEYYYRVPGSNNLPYEIISYGSNGESGGEGTEKDIYSWRRR